MKHRKWLYTLFISGTLLLGVMLGACVAAKADTPTPHSPTATVSAPAPAVSPATFTVEKNTHFYYRNQGYEKYTQAEYDLAISFMVDGWQDMTIADFNAKLFPDIKDEERFHAVYDPLWSVLLQYKGTDPNVIFLDSLERSVKEASVLHYNACVHNEIPWMWGDAEYKRYEDVYGDQVQVASGYVDFSYGYTFPDATKVTVGQRNAFFQNLEQGVQAFLDKQTEADLKNEAVMEKALAAELERLVAEHSGSIIAVTGGEVSYYWENFYE